MSDLLCRVLCSNLMSNNVAFGTAKAAPYHSKAEPSTAAAERPVAEEQQAQPSSRPEPAPPFEAASSRDSVPAQPDAAHARPDAAAQPASKAESAEHSDTAKSAQPQTGRTAKLRPRVLGPLDATADEEAEQAPDAAAEETKPQASKGEKLASARDRYLARKRKLPDV